MLPTSILLPTTAGVPVDLPSGDAVIAAMDSAMERVRRCGAVGSQQLVVVTVGFAPSGEAVDARVFPPFAGTTQGACVRDSVMGIRLSLPSPRAFEMTWRYSTVETTPVECHPLPPPPSPSSDRGSRDTPRTQNGPVECGQLDPTTGLIRICFDHRSR